MAKSKDEESQGAEKVVRVGREAVKAAVEDPSLNVIEFVLSPTESSSGPSKRNKKSRESAPNSVEGVSKPKTLESALSRTPDSVSERFIQIGNNFYFPDGAEAFNREQNRLTTRSENAIVIQSMVAVAREESEKGIVRVGGTEFFRKEAWFAASLVGLQVQGYEPTEFERERLVRAIAARRPAKPLEKEQNAPDESKQAVQKGDEKEQQSLNTHELITGRLVDHGPAPYQHNPKENPSYFVRIETERGDREIWGVDLERAFRHSLSTPGIGDEIGIRAIGKEAVTVQATKRDADGREIGQEALNTHRNQWIVERKEFLDQRQAMATVFKNMSISAAEGIKRHAGLEGAYLQLQMGQAMAEEQYGTKAHRQQFVDHLRAHLAQGIEYGQPLEPVRLRVREDRTPEPHVPDHDYNPTR